MTSTSQFLLDILTNSSPNEGLVVSSDFQTEGRGQIGRSWQSQHGKNLLNSIYLEPKFLRIREAFYLNIVASLAVHSILDDLNIKNVKVKWPNDVYVNDKKIGGILIQNIVQGDYIQKTVIGIGLNVNQVAFNDMNATSLFFEIGSESDIVRIMSKLWKALDGYYLILKTKNNKQKLLSQYNDVLYRHNRVTKFKDLVNGDQEFFGKITSVDGEGVLSMQCENSIRTFQKNEIRYIVEG